MKILNKIFAALSISLSIVSLASCAKDSFQENTALDLYRCLTPAELSAKVLSTKGNYVTFNWNVTTDAEQYNLVVYDNKAMDAPVLDVILDVDEMPYGTELEADKTYYFKVQALNGKKKASNWAIYSDDSGKPKSFTTFAVKDQLYLKVAGRNSTSMDFSWSNEVEDFKDVDRIEFSTPDKTITGTYQLTGDDKDNACATVPGLNPSTEYEFTLFFLTAARGQVNAWTLPDMTGLLEVSTEAALKQALTDGANISLKLEGSPYTVCTDGKGFDLPKGVKIYGETAADGKHVRINGSFNIVDSFDGGSLYFEGVEFNGNGTEGFALQHKEGSTKDGVAVEGIVYKNCDITGYSKGIFYEWGKTLDIGAFTYESCQIYEVNGDGAGGGDGFDLRQATTIDALTINNCTIWNGFRTFLRVDSAPVIGDVKFSNNTVMNLCFVDNTNNGGIIAFQTKPASFTMMKNLFLNMAEKATLIGANTKYLSFEALGILAGSNYFYNMSETFFNDNAPAAKAGKILDADPCYNAKGGLFNLLPDSEISGNGIGASKWWTPYSKEPEDLTIHPIEKAHTWNLGNAALFSGTIKEPIVREDLGFIASQDFPITFNNNMVEFPVATPVNRKGAPIDQCIFFLVNKPGSVVLKASGDASSHIIVATAPSGLGLPASVSFKGGVSPMDGSEKAQKVIIKDVAEETGVYIFVSGPIALSQIAWSEDTHDVNTALPTPNGLTVSPATQKAGEAKDVVITWKAVENAGGYSAVFNKKTYAVEEGALSFTVEGKTTGMLDAGAYDVSIYANPASDDIYNTMSEAGVISFAILPKGGDDPVGGTVVHSVEELQAALDAGKDDITIASDGAPYKLSETLTLTYPVKIAGEGASKPVVEGAVVLSGEIDGDVTISGLTFDDTATGKGCFITLPEAGVTMNTLTVSDCVLKGYSKSVIYGNYNTDNIGKVLFSGNETHDWGTGQGMIDFRKGTYGSIVLVGNTFKGGRDFLRADGNCVIGEISVINNTFDGNNLVGNGNGLLYVRASVPSYKVMNNLWLNEVAEGQKILFTKASGVAVPDLANNFYYNIDEVNFFSGLVTREMGIAKNGTVLAEDPVKDAANYDYTLVSGLAISNKVGAPKWNPAAPVKPTSAYTVKSADEFKAALEAGKTEITLAAEGSPYIFLDSDVETDGVFEIVKDLKVYGEVKDGQYPEFHGTFKASTAEAQLGDVVFKNVKFSGIKGGAEQSRGNLLEISASANFRSLSVIDCIVDNFSKSVLYGNGDGSTAASAVFNGVTVQNHGTGQGVFDIRKGAYTNVTIKNCTIIGGRDLIRADAGTVTGAFDFVNNTVDGSNLGVNGNGIMYVRATPSVYKFKNNLFLNEIQADKKVILSKTSGVTVPTDASNNFFFNFDETNFFSGLFTREVVKAVCLTVCPVKDAANHNYTLTDALCLGSNVGAAKWNPNHGKVVTEITVANMEELINALNAGKTSINLKYGTYDFTTAPAEETAFSGGVFTATTPIVFKGEKFAGMYPEIIGGIRFGEGVTDVTVENLVFNGNAKAIGCTFEVPAALSVGKILIRNCEVKDYSKSLFYGNADGAIGALTFDRLLVHGFGTGQGTIDIRKELYDAVVISNSTFYNGGRDFIRLDAEKAKSLTIKNNTFAGISIDAANSILYVRADMGDQYVVANNLFLNETGTTTILSKSGTKVPVLKNNFFFNCSSPAFWNGPITEAIAIGEGVGVKLEADPCVNSAEFNFKVTDKDVKAAKAGDPRWL